MSLSFILHFDIAGSSERAAQPCADNIKVANVTWHKVIHIDYYYTFKSTYVNRVKGRLATLCVE